MATPQKPDARDGEGSSPWRWLPAVRRGERGRFGFFLALQFLLTLGETLGLAGSEALLIGRQGAAALPAAFILAACFAMASSLVYAAWVGRSRNDDLLTLLLAAFALLLFAGSLGAGMHVPGVPTALFCVFFATNTIFGNHFWTFAGDHFDTLASKRLFPLFTVGGSVGGALGGGLAAGLALVGPAEWLIAAWAAALAATAALLLWARRSLRRWGPLAFEESDETSVESLRTALRHARSTPMGRWMVLSAAAMVTSLFVSQYLYSEVFALHFPGPEELAAFFGVFLLVTNSVEIGIELFVTPRLIARFGLARANLIHPLTTLLAFGGLAADFRLAPAIFARANREMLENALAEPVRNLVYNALPPRLRGRMRALLEGLVVTSGMALAGGVLLALGRPDPLWLCAVGGAAALLYAIANFGVQRAYLQALVTQLRSGRLDLADLGEGLAGVPAERLVTLWNEILADETQRPALPELAPLLARRGTLEPLIEASRHADPRVRLAAASALGGALPQPPQARRALEDLRGDPAPAVRAEAAACLGRAGEAMLASMAASEDPAAAVAALARLPVGLAAPALARLDDPSPQVRTAALDGLARLGAGASAGASRLAAAARDESPTVRCAAVAALGSLPGRPGDDALADALDDPDAGVRRAAVSALSRRGEGAREIARQRLGSSRGHVAAAAIDLLGEAGDGPALHEALRTRTLAAWRNLLAAHALDGPADADGRFLEAAYLDALGRDLRLAFRALARLEDPALVRSIERALRLGPAAARTEALEVLTNLSDRESTSLLALLHEDGPVEDRIRGLPRLAEMPRSREEALRVAEASEEPWLRLAARGAGEPSDREAMERLLALRRVPLFTHLSLDQLQSIAGAMHEESFVTGEVVVREGEPGSELYLLLEGEVAIRSGLGTPREVELNRLSAVTYLGEMAVLDDAPRSASVVVTRDARLSSLAGARLKELILQMPEISFDIFRELIARVRRAERAGEDEPRADGPNPVGS